MDALETEESFMWNKQSISASASSSSEVSDQLSRMTRVAFRLERNSSSSLRRTSGPVRRAKCGWKPQEDEELKRVVSLHMRKNWKKIAQCLPGRTDVQCLHRWQKVLHPDLVKGPWTQEEDDKLIKLVDMYGPRKWSEISKSLAGRIGKQCRERWHNHLKPEIRRDAWTPEEERVIVQAHMELGNKWTEIANKLPGRTNNSIKNYWHSSLKRKANCYLESESDTNGKTTPEKYCAASSHRVDTSKLEGKKKCLETIASPDITLRESEFSNDHEIQAFDKVLVHEKSEPRIKSEANIFTRETHQNEEPLKTTQKSLPANHDSLCSKSAQIEDFGVSSSSSTFSHFNNDVFSPPSSHLTRSSMNVTGSMEKSVESILKSAARSFTNIPSIIRRREVQTPLLPDTILNKNRILDSCISNESRMDDSVKGSGYQNRVKRGNFGISRETS